MQNIKTALVAGGSGLVGNALIQQLLNSQQFNKVTSITRKPLNIINTKYTEHLINFDNLNNSQHLINATDVFCTLGTTIKKAGSKTEFTRIDYEIPLKMATLAAQNKCQRFYLVTAAGANPNSAIFYNKVKGNLENQIINLPFESVYIFRPSLILGKRNEPRFGESIAKKIMPLFSALMIGKLAQYKPISEVKIAKSMLNYAENPKKGVYFIENLSMLSA